MISKIKFEYIFTFFYMYVSVYTYVVESLYKYEQLCRFIFICRFYEFHIRKKFLCNLIYIPNSQFMSIFRILLE